LINASEVLGKSEGGVDPSPKLKFLRQDIELFASPDGWRLGENEKGVDGNVFEFDLPTT